MSKKEEGLWPCGCMCVGGAGRGDFWLYISLFLCVDLYSLPFSLLLIFFWMNFSLANMGLLFLSCVWVYYVSINLVQQKVHGDKKNCT